MNPIIVVGAGVAGLTVARQLAENGIKVILLEREKSVGGLARSFRYGDFTFDVGPHRFHTDRQQIELFIRSVLGQNALEIKRKSSVFYRNRYYEWPFRTSSLMHLPPSILAGALKDLVFPASEDGQSFESFVVRKYGRTLYETFFKEYSEKFCSIHPRDLHMDWAVAGMERAVIDKKLKFYSLLNILKITLLPKAVSNMFIYPRGGNGVFSDMLRQAILDRGGRFFTGIEEIKLVRGQDRINAVVFDGQEWEVEFLIWTAPITRLAELLNIPVPDLHYLKIANFNMELNRQLDEDNQWVYFGDKDLTFSRISFPRNFYAGNVPAGRDSLCIEATVADELIWRNPGLLKERIIGDLERIRLISKSDIQAVHVEKIMEAYPVYTLGYKEELDRVNTDLARYKNLQCAGRTGLFWYNNMDESIEKGLKLAEAVIHGEFPTAWRWWQEGI